VPAAAPRYGTRNRTQGPTPARDTYTGSPFKVNREYAERFGDSWVILSAKLRLPRPRRNHRRPLQPTFSARLNPPIEISVCSASRARDKELDRFSDLIGLGGRDYRAVIEQSFASSSVRPPLSPFAGMGLGESLGAAKENGPSPFGQAIPAQTPADLAARSSDVHRVVLDNTQATRWTSSHKQGHRHLRPRVCALIAEIAHEDPQPWRQQRPRRSRTGSWARHRS